MPRTVDRKMVRSWTEGLAAVGERLVGVYSDPESQAFSYPTGEVVQFVTCCFLYRVVGGELRTDVDLMPMHPTWLEDAFSGEVSLVR